MISSSRFFMVPDTWVSLLLLTAVQFSAAATVHAISQNGDFLDFEGKRVEVYSTPLEPYPTILEDRPNFGPSGTAIWRGYIARWKIEAETLILVSLHKEDWGSTLQLGKEIPLSQVFPDAHSLVEVTWSMGKAGNEESEASQ